MTIRELIEELKAIPDQNLRVMVNGENGDADDLEKIVPIKVKLDCYKATDRCGMQVIVTGHPYEHFTEPQKAIATTDALLLAQ